MTYTAVIQKVETGETAERAYPNWQTADFSWWTEGNFSCDCNRELEFERGLGHDPDLDSVECGDNRFTLLKLKFENGDEYIV